MCLCAGDVGCGGVKGFWQKFDFFCDADVIKTPLSSNEELLVLFCVKGDSYLVSFSYQTSKMGYKNYY